MPDTEDTEGVGLHPDLAREGGLVDLISFAICLADYLASRPNWVRHRGSYPSSQGAGNHERENCAIILPVCENGSRTSIFDIGGGRFQNLAATIKCA